MLTNGKIRIALGVACIAAIAIILSVAYRSGWFGWGGRDGSPDATIAQDEPAPDHPSVPRPVPVDIAVPILVYHYIREPQFGLADSSRQYEVAPELFAEQLAYLKGQGFESVHMTDIAAAFFAGKPLPEKPVIITFDDGRDSQYTAAFPLLKEYGFTATFFVFTNAMDRPGYLTWDQLAEMRDAGMEIGSHGIYHPYLTRLSDEEMRAELVGSRAKLQEMLGVSGDVIAYPFGLNDERVRVAVAEAGYVAGRDLDHVVTFTADDVMALGSYIITSNMKWFEKILAGEAR